MDEKIKPLLAAFCGALTALAENYGTICSICCALILLDLLTGLAKAKIQGKLNSDTGYKGFWRKAALLAALAFGICLDLLVEYAAAAGLGAEFPALIGRLSPSTSPSTNVFPSLRTSRPAVSSCLVFSLPPSGAPGTSSTSADLCPHYSSVRISCKSCRKKQPLFLHSDAGENRGGFPKNFR